MPRCIESCWWDHLVKQQFVYYSICNATHSPSFYNGKPLNQLLNTLSFGVMLKHQICASITKKIGAMDLHLAKPPGSLK